MDYLPYATKLLSHIIVALATSQTVVSSVCVCVAPVVLVGGSHHSPLALQRALARMAPHLARPMAHGTAKSFGTQVHTSTVCQNSLAVCRSTAEEMGSHSASSRPARPRFTDNIFKVRAPSRWKR